MILFICTYQYLSECIVVIAMLSFSMFLLLEYSYVHTTTTYEFFIILSIVHIDVYSIIYFLMCMTICTLYCVIATISTS
jgi:hypothetical protein